MARQNRVDPFGRIIADPARGTLMGNRGCLHDSAGNIKKQSARKAWVTCALEYNNRHREIMAPGKYTELFFLDEATALAAGHRPCGTCRKPELKAFRQAWTEAHGLPSPPPLSAIDTVLHRERYASTGQLSEAQLTDLPNGVFVQLAGEDGTAWLKWQGSLHRWGPSGYSGHQKISPITVQVVTPLSITCTLGAGYVPDVELSEIENE